MILTKHKLLKKICVLGLSATMLTGMVLSANDSVHKKNVITEAGTSYDGEVTYGGKTYRYKNDGNNIILMSVTAGGELNIPSSLTINGKSRNVVGLGDYFGYNQSFTKVYVPDSVKKLENSVFAYSTMNYLKLSANLEYVDSYVGVYSNISEVYCTSKKITHMGDYIFYGSKGSYKVIFGDWLVKYKPKNGVIDLTSSDFYGVKKAVNYVFNLEESIDTLKVGNDATLLKDEYYWQDSKNNIKNVYVNGNKVVCKSVKDVLPTILINNYGPLEKSIFGMDYSKQKAKYVLEGLGIKYVGIENKKKASLSKTEIYNIGIKLYEYMVKEYVYDKDKVKGEWTYTRVFNCHTDTVCRYDAEIYAFLLESAGVEAETVSSGEPHYMNESEIRQMEKDGIKYNMSNDYVYYFKHYGQHEWNVIKIGNEWFYVDITKGRCENSYSSYLFSNYTIEKEAKNVLDYSKGYRGNHGYPYRTYYSDYFPSYMYCFQDYCNSLCVFDCNKVHGDLDMNYDYCDEDDLNYMQGYFLLNDNLKNIILNSTPNKPVKGITVRDGWSLNGGVVYKTVKIAGKEQKVQTKIEFLYGGDLLAINPKELDVNFDGVVDFTDYFAMNKLVGKVDYSK